MPRDMIWLGPITMRQIAEAVAENHGVTLRDLKGRSRKAEVVAARQAAALAMWETGRFNKSAIGRALGRAPKTALHAIRRARGESYAQAKEKRGEMRRAQP